MGNDSFTTNWGTILHQYETRLLKNLCWKNQQIKVNMETSCLLTLTISLMLTHDVFIVRKAGLLLYCQTVSCIYLLLTENVSEPQGQVFLHGQQAGFMSTGQPLVVLLHVCEAGATWLFGAQGATHGSLLTAWGRRGGGEHTKTANNVNLQCELANRTDMYINCIQGADMEINTIKKKRVIQYNTYVLKLRLRHWGVDSTAWTFSGHTYVG